MFFIHSPLTYFFMLDLRLVAFVKEEIRRGRTKNELTDLLLGAGLTRLEIVAFWNEFLSTNTVPQGFDVVKPASVEKKEDIIIPVKGGNSKPQIQTQSQSSQEKPQPAIVKRDNKKVFKSKKIKYFTIALFVVALILVVVYLYFKILR